MALILVVDDDPDILKVLKANLEIAGFEVATATNCAETWQFINKRIPDLIVLDLMLPDGDGMDLCRELRKRHISIPVIMLTARDGISDRVLGLESGADDYVVKPFEAIELVARIKACLRRTSLDSLERLRAGEIVVDVPKRMVRVRGKRVDLTPKEFELLCLFINHREKVLTRDFIRNSLWKDNKKLYSWSRVIDVHIQHLRSKIEKDPSNPKYIITIPGVGYRFMPSKR